MQRAPGPAADSLVILIDCREQAQTIIAQDKPANWWAAGGIALTWLAVAI